MQSHSDKTLKVLENIRTGTKFINEATKSRIGLVQKARKAGVSWADIAEMLGTARQTAWKTYSKHCNE